MITAAGTWPVLCFVRAKLMVAHARFKLFIQVMRAFPYAWKVRGRISTSFSRWQSKNDNLCAENTQRAWRLHIFLVFHSSLRSLVYPTRWHELKTYRHWTLTQCLQLFAKMTPSSKSRIGEAIEPIEVRKGQDEMEEKGDSSKWTVTDIIFMTYFR